MTKKEIEERLRLLSDLKIHPRDRSENRLLLARGERMYEESIGEMRTYISNILSQFEMVMSKQNDCDVKKAAEELKKILDDIERRYDF